MIRDLDETLRAMLPGEADPGSVLSTVVISFDIPDAEWRKKINKLALNVYLCGLSEDRELRTNQRRLHVENGWTQVQRTPPRVRCSYVITAWNLTTPVTGAERVLDEHRLLSQVVTVLLRHRVVPARYLSGLLTSPEVDPPLVAAEAEGPGIASEFWSALGTSPRPAVTCRVTLALTKALPPIQGPALTTARLRVRGDDERILIGGTVTEAMTARAVPNALVLLLNTGQETRTDTDGRYRFDGLLAGTYTIDVRAGGYRHGGGPLQVPSPSGLYDITLTAL